MQIKVRFESRPIQRWARLFSKQTLLRAARVMGPTLVALSFAGVAHAQGTMDFSGATTLMTTFKTFAIYAGAVICFGGLIFAGIRMMSGRFQDAIPGLFGALFGAGVLGWGAGWIGFDHGYAVTSHSAQGLTAERVLVNIDTTVHPELINTRFAYVSVSRASHEAQIYTNDATLLVSGLSHDATKSSAVEIGKAHDALQGIMHSVGKQQANGLEIEFSL
ncbi:MAG: traI protein helicase [Acidobacteriaceae bacterium]|nr:traI protein helicase [Acidobacteriaceae bacterium]